MKLIENNVPTKDIIFQLLFGRNKNRHLTDNFIKSTFKYINEDTTLNNIHINSEVSLEKLKIKDKSIRLDIIAEYDEKIVCIEMQNKNYNNNKNINWGLKYIFIFLPKLKELGNEDLNDDFLKWLKFIEYKDMEVIEHMAKKNKFIEEAQNEMFVLTAEQEEKNWQRFRENYLIERKFDRAEFFREGKKEGINQTILAIKMLLKKRNIQEIIKSTGLSEEEIKELAESI